MGFSCLKVAASSLQKFLALIWSTLEGWKAESTLEPPSGFEPGTPGLEIQLTKPMLHKGHEGVDSTPK